MAIDTFTCQICGQERHVRYARSAYCTECWNAYQQFRNSLKKAGKNSTVKGYRQFRREQGMLTTSVEPRRGRPTGSSSQAIMATCSGCLRLANTYAVELDGLFRTCSACVRNWKEWQAVDTRLTLWDYMQLQNGSRELFPNGGILAAPGPGAQRKLHAWAHQYLENKNEIFKTVKDKKEARKEVEGN